MLHQFADASGDLARLVFNLAILLGGAWIALQIVKGLK